MKFSLSLSRIGVSATMTDFSVSWEVLVLDDETSLAVVTVLSSLSASASVAVTAESLS